MAPRARGKLWGKTPVLAAGLQWAQKVGRTNPVFDPRTAEGDSLDALRALQVVRGFRKHVEVLRKKQQAGVINRLVP